MSKMPDGTYFDIGDETLMFHASTHAKAREIRSFFKDTKWTRKYESGLEWWEWVCEFSEEITIKIIAINDNPANCTAIFEKQMVTEKVPVTFEERTVEKDVIVGWNCGDKEEPEEEAND